MEFIYPFKNNLTVSEPRLETLSGTPYPSVIIYTPKGNIYGVQLTDIVLKNLRIQNKPTKINLVYDILNVYLDLRNNDYKLRILHPTEYDSITKFAYNIRTHTIPNVTHGSMCAGSVKLRRTMNIFDCFIDNYIRTYISSDYFKYKIPVIIDNKDKQKELEEQGIISVGDKSITFFCDRIEDSISEVQLC